MFRPCLCITRRWYSSALDGVAHGLTNVFIEKPVKFENAVVGHTLTGRYENESKRRPLYQWYRHIENQRTPIQGANNIWYQTTSEDAGVAVSFEVSVQSNDSLQLLAVESPPETIEEEYLYKVVQQDVSHVKLSAAFRTSAQVLAKCDSVLDFEEAAQQVAQCVVTPAAEWYSAQANKVAMILEDRSVMDDAELDKWDGPCDPLREIVGHMFGDGEDLEADKIVARHLEQFHNYSMEEKVASYQYVEKWQQHVGCLLKICRLLHTAVSPEGMDLPVLHRSILLGGLCSRNATLSAQKINRAVLFINTIMTFAATKGDMLLVQLLIAVKEVWFGRDLQREYHWDFWDHDLNRMAFFKWKEVLPAHNNHRWDKMVMQANRSNKDKASSKAKLPLLQQYNTEAMITRASTRRSEKLARRMQRRTGSPSRIEPMQLAEPKPGAEPSGYSAEGINGFRPNGLEDGKLVQ